MEFLFELTTAGAKAEDLTNSAKMWSESNVADGARFTENGTMVSWSDTDLYQDRPVSSRYVASEEFTPRSGRCWEDKAVEGHGKEGTGEHMVTAGSGEEVGKKKNSIFMVDNASDSLSNNSCWRSMTDVESDGSTTRRPKHGPGKSGISQDPSPNSGRSRRGGVGAEIDASGTKGTGWITSEAMAYGNGKARKTSRCGNSERTGNTFQMSMFAETAGQDTTDCTGSSGESGTGNIADDVYWIRVSEETEQQKSTNSPKLNRGTTTGILSTHIIPLRPPRTHENRRHNDVAITITNVAEHPLDSMTSSSDVISVALNDVTVSREPGFFTAEQTSTLLPTSRDIADITRNELSSASCDVAQRSLITSAVQADVNGQPILSAAHQRSPLATQSDAISTYTSFFKVTRPEIADQVWAASENKDAEPTGGFPWSGGFRGVLVGHTNTITDCRVLRSHIVTSSLDSTIRVWHRKLLTKVRTLHYMVIRIQGRVQKFCKGKI